MTLAGISRDDVLAAVAECDDLGRLQFLEAYGSTGSAERALLHEGRQYDPIAVVASAYRRASGSAAPSVAEREFLNLLSGFGFELSKAGYGEIAGVPEGSVFDSRKAAAQVQVHRAPISGIVGNGRDGAESIVASHKYEDDKDFGNMIVYTGHGGRGDSGKQESDQSFSAPGNAALRTSMITGAPVRVIRGHNPQRRNVHAPDSGYRYDGLFRVARAWIEPGLRGFKVCRFELVKIAAESGFSPELTISDDTWSLELPTGNLSPGRRLSTVRRVIRSTVVGDRVKRIHDHTCQLCGIRLSVKGRGYSEGAHIQPLGGSHAGPDIPSNVLCLCPTCHVLFDYGELTVAEDLALIHGGERLARKLRVHPDHGIGAEYLSYHRETVGLY
ncbi:Predicted restriction endonuclease [Amycolatopsis xylanica]|uniref:Predicted restriction endonuclease n=1 Tax=Amycolatopsis xylanica TaxID=589385 RepID=A0A1H3T662_9PSEU|nr:YDG/SRA domain-containing protein [Amycolatopsis xylanica]SDZ45550.1 Predicted restriction endonuclease [Amycolatopsis xylanica]